MQAIDKLQFFVCNRTGLKSARNVAGVSGASSIIFLHSWNGYCSSLVWEVYANGFTSGRDSADQYCSWGITRMPLRANGDQENGFQPT
jgi:hypothetical protein